MNKMKKITILSILLLSISPAIAKDNTGTNPINFTKDFRVYHNYLDLDTEGDGTLNTTTVEYRTPFADDKWQFRVRVPFVNSDIDLTGNGVDDIDNSGIGDVNFRLLTVPIMNMEKKFALAAGVEVYLDTAEDNDNGSTLIAPQVFAVWFKPPGGGALVAPAIQPVFDVDGTDVFRTQLDLFYLYTFKDKFFNWALINPQAVIDHENDDNDHSNIDFEVGKMITKSQSWYVRPGVGIGADRYYDWDFEAGWKNVW